jgi:geranyl-CoA carboxylase alpha subunit
MFGSLLVANRGEIALRVMRTAQAMGLRTIAVYSAHDRAAPHVRAADCALPIKSYLDVESILEAASRCGADALHPGYGFLAENAGFAQAVIDAGLAWVGPPPAAMRALGDKLAAKRHAAAAGVPVLPVYEEKEAEFPLMIKAAAGGGGRGMRLVSSKGDLAAAIVQAGSEAKHAFGDESVFLERAVAPARHIEVQIFADGHGNCIHLGERDCSVQRRHQKLIEESPSPAVNETLRKKLGEAAIRLARAAGYVGAGTVEFLLEPDGRFWFMEMNTRLQVEHPVTELLTGLDLVEWQLRIAAGDALPCSQEEITFSGHAIEARLCAEDPAAAFLPQSGRLALWRAPQGVRVDHALESSLEITPHYDSLMAKLVVHANNREVACAKLANALDRTVALGITTNKAFLASVLRDPEFMAGPTTAFLEKRGYQQPKPDAATLSMAALLLGKQTDFGEWAFWSNDASHALRARFGEAEVSIPYGDIKALEDTVDFVVEGDTVHLARGGQSWTLENTLHAPPARPVAALDGKGLSAPMNGRVVAHAKAGDKVEAGRPLVVLEAMKMEHGLSVEIPVIVRAVHVSTGAQVAPGHLLLEFEAAA